MMEATKFRSLPKKRLGAWVPVDVHKRFRSLIVELDLAPNAALTRALEDFLERHEDSGPRAQNSLSI